VLISHQAECSTRAAVQGGRLRLRC
jgi:hypothetical protein